MCLLAPQRIPRVSSLFQTQSAVSFSECQHLCLLCEQLDQQVHLIPLNQLKPYVYSLYLC